MFVVIRVSEHREALQHNRCLFLIIVLKQFVEEKGLDDPLVCDI